MRGREQSLDVTQGVIWRQLLQLGVPIFFSSFFQQSYSLINTYVVGQFGGKLALGGIEATAVLVDLLVGFSVGMGSGCAVVSGQYFGAHDQRRLSASMHTALGLALVGGLAFSALGLVLLEPLLRLMDTPQELMGESLAYGRCYMAAMVFSLVYNMGSALQRAVGDTHSPSVIVASTCVVNVALDLLFVAGLHLDALGCGIATAGALLFGMVVTLWRLCHVDEPWRVHLSQIHIDGRICRRMLSTGLPLGLQSACYSLSNMIVQHAINGFGADATTGWGLSSRLDAVVWMLSDALGVSVTTFAAQNFGARNYERMRSSLKVSLVLTTIVVGGTSALIYAFSSPLARFFMNDDGVVADTTLMLHYIAPFYVLFSLSDNVAGIIRGAGESFRPMLMTLLGTVVFRVVWLLWALPLNTTLDMVLVVYPVTWAMTGAMFVVYYRHGHWLQHARQCERSNLAA